jgi:hypothetical protein
VRCQADVLEAEKAEAVKMIAEYREAETLHATNDIAARNHKLEESGAVITPADVIRGRNPGICPGGGNPMKRLTLEERLAIEAELKACDHQQFLVACSQLQELRESAVDLAKTILGRLVKSFDAELAKAALEAEARLETIGLPIGNHAYWELHHNPELLARHSWREMARNAIRNLNMENSIGSVQWLATTEATTQSVPWV